MSREQQKLAQMLQENKINEADYRLLLSALERTSEQSIFSWMINPFQKIAGLQALVLGLLVILSLSIIGTYARVYFAGVLDCLNAANLKHLQVMMPNFKLLLMQNIIDWLVLSTVFLIAALLLKQKRIRVIDFYGTVALARFPYIILSLFIALVWIISPQSLNFDLTDKTMKFEFSYIGKLLDFMWQFCYAWLITTYFFAFKESSGLNGTRLWIGFVISLFIADQIAHPIGSWLWWK